VYGYAAFGLTVTPYIITSLVNLMGQIATPEYPTIFMVHPAEMDEARRPGGFSEDVIGTATTSSADSISWAVKGLENKKLSLSVLEAPTDPSSQEPTKMSKVSSRQQNSEIHSANSLNLTAPCTFKISQDNLFIIPSCSYFGYENTSQ
jgi:hypothetical protein